MKTRKGNQEIVRIWDIKNKRYISPNRKHYWVSVKSAIQKIKNMCNPNYCYSYDPKPRHENEFEMHSFKVVMTDKTTVAREEGHKK